MIQIVSWTAWLVWIVTWIYIHFKDGKCFWGSMLIGVIIGSLVGIGSLIHCQSLK